MSVINVLDKDVYNKIAAGEVVEKPASVVKELVENSIDAGATNIVVEILDGGIKQIKVSDNGSGIVYDDFEKVFLPHATSKVKTVEDLAKIGTLGFRGEALSSIASVSKITLSLIGSKNCFSLAANWARPSRTNSSSLQALGNWEIEQQEKELVFPNSK